MQFNIARIIHGTGWKRDRIGGEDPGRTSDLRIPEKCQRYSHGTVGGPVCDPDEDRWNDDDGPGVIAE